MQNRATHWENIYQTKDISTVSWYQPTPLTSLELIADCNLDKDAAIIDIGGGDSFLPDHLLALGYTNITVLDISEKALSNAKLRLGEDASKIRWILEDVTKFCPKLKYDLWHDRAAFHFLRDDKEIQAYGKLVSENLIDNGKAIIGTFSNNGPTKCSGIEISQYSKDELSKVFAEDLFIDKCINVDHTTPSKAVQNFTFCTFSKKG